MLWGRAEHGGSAETPPTLCRTGQVSSVLAEVDPRFGRVTHTLPVWSPALLLLFISVFMRQLEQPFMFKL